MPRSATSPHMYRGAPSHRHPACLAAVLGTLMNPTLPLFLAAAIVSSGAAAAQAAPATPATPSTTSTPSTPPTAPLSGLPRADAAELAALRGGFTTNTGLQISLGVERTISVNGEVLARQSLGLAEVAGRGAGAVAAHEALSDIKLVQNGAGNVMVAPLSAQASGGLVIQNTLNDQRIQTQTVINAAVNSADIIKSLNFQGSLGDALARAR